MCAHILCILYYSYAYMCILKHLCLMRLIFLFYVEHLFFCPSRSIFHPFNLLFALRYSAELIVSVGSCALYLLNGFSQMLSMAGQRVKPEWFSPGFLLVEMPQLAASLDQDHRFFQVTLFQSSFSNAHTLFPLLVSSGIEEVTILRSY